MSTDIEETTDLIESTDIDLSTDFREATDALPTKKVRGVYDETNRV